MIDIEDKTHQPTLAEIEEYIGNPLFAALYGHMEAQYKSIVTTQYSGDSVLLGWNLRFCKGGRTLLRLYPKRGYFSVLVVVGSRERERTEAALPAMSAAMNEIYRNTKEGMGQRWMIIDLNAEDELYEDVLRLVRIRREIHRP